jgi:tRNA(Ile)-lysidine synthase
VSRSLTAHLKQALADSPPVPLCVAFSGGPDSSALLHALATLDASRERGLLAVHVDHGLHPESTAWARHCRDFCTALDIPVRVLKVQVDHAGEGLEGAARKARYAALVRQLEPGAWLVTAHHADDQAETVLLKLLRGAGPQGLGGMRALRAIGPGMLWRPLLDLPRAALAKHAHDHQLHCIDDPANSQTEHARNFLRHDILPRLQQRWPQAPRILVQGAQLEAEAADFIDLHVKSALAQWLRQSDASLDAGGWLELHPAVRGLVLEQWLRKRDLTAPTRAQRHELERQVREADADRVPEVTWPGACVRLWRGRLHALPTHAARPTRPWRSAWDGQRLGLPGGGSVQLVGAGDRAALPAMEIRLGQTGVRLRPHGDAHTRALRDVFQRAGIPPWQRPGCPLIHAGDGTLLAVADLCMTAPGHVLFSRCALAPRWERGS